MREERGEFWQKTVSALIYLLFGLTVLYPVGVATTACFGCRFELMSVRGFGFGIGGLAVSTVILSLLFRYRAEGKGMGILLTALTPLSLINALFYIFVCPEGSVLIACFVSAGCCCYLTIRHGKPLELKLVALGFSVLLAFAAVLLSFFFMFFLFGEDQVVKTVVSPEGDFYAQVIASSQGALGGDTFVDVYEDWGFHALLFQVRKKPQRIYIGPWWEHSTLGIRWKDEGCLLINGREYPIE